MFMRKLGGMAIRYLTTSEAAARCGITVSTWNRYKTPPEDAITGKIKGYLPQTVDEWNARRPGQGNKKDPRWNLPEEYR